ncbi:GGDEF domain-containing protein [Actinoplanes sp. KI2]|uniref:bifunctional diguanylate cyclase/phosphodiesterase n=1 Tax=Actinoplanes sp. KI2 TaxID=2983315 RepID=UPI0021D59B7F|nr:GGDEF domain-containing protein [Actinoplanes sp. KI2]MCU7728637.1 GGDEF domain-containing protein [Actinoplanes sp. KI2]
MGTTNASLPSEMPRRRLHTVRATAALSVLAPLACLPYLAFTWPAGNRPAMVAICTVMMLFAGFAVIRADAIERSRYRVVAQLTGLSLNVVGFTVLGWLDGGVNSTLGAVLPLLIILLALGMPLRPFLALAALGAAGYWATALSGGPGQLGYALIYTIHVGGVSMLAIRYSAAMVSLQRRLGALSRTDPLTGCLNRRGFEERLAAELAEADRTGTGAVMFLVDLDGFKTINDKYGHQAGDDLLAWTGRTLTEQLRVRDVVGRVGGDEFAAVLGGLDPDDVPAVLERLHAGLRGVAAAGIGYACYPSEADTPQALRELADQRVYLDKAAHDRTVPAEVAVAGVRGDSARHQPATVSQHERRHRAITNAGHVSLFTAGLALVYVLLMATGNLHRWLMAALLVAACSAAVAVIAASARLSRTRAARFIMPASGVVQFALCSAVVCLDGGVNGTLGFGMITLMPLVALVTPKVGRMSLPLIAVCYLAVAVFVGEATPWYVLTHLGGALVVSMAFADRGRVAAAQRRRMRELSRVDVLTKCLNRRGFLERSADLLTRARLAGRDLSLLILDLDRFKEVNDSAGHAAGDELLCWVGATLKERLHPQDVVGRFGGDEFVVLLASCGADEVDDVAGDITGALAQRIGVSVGAGLLGRDGTDLDELYSHADAELYRQKLARGRGRSRRLAAADGSSSSTLAA